MKLGQTIGKYVIEAVLGEGGMGTVYRARHVTLGRAAAVKVLLPELSSNADSVVRFFNEARAATLVQHLGIVEVYDFGRMADGVGYIAMELLHGESLGQRMKQRVEPIAALRFTRLICGALAAAHDRGIIHRDLKPDNVFVIADPEVAGGERIKLLDFGIAKLTQDGLGRISHKTQTGTLLGTPAYMAPEQCRGVAVDQRADIYALGCMLYQFFAGRPPFRGEGVGDVLGAHMYSPPPGIPGIDPGVWRLIDRMLAKRPEHRLPSARAAIDAIDALLATGVAGTCAEPSAAGPSAGAAASDAARAAFASLVGDSGDAMTTELAAPARIDRAALSGRARAVPAERRAPPSRSLERGDAIAVDRAAAGDPATALRVQPGGGAAMAPFPALVAGSTAAATPGGPAIREGTHQARRRVRRGAAGALAGLAAAAAVVLAITGGDRPALQPRPASPADRDRGAAEPRLAAGMLGPVLPGGSAPRARHAPDADTVNPASDPTTIAAVSLPGAAPEIRVQIDSAPRGGQVSLDGKLLGATPYRGAVPRSDRVLTFTIRHPGYSDLRIAARGDGDIDRTLALTPRPATPVGRRSPERGRGRIGSDDEVNPF
jgi:serine/threonine-protein kinase